MKTRPHHRKPRTSETARRRSAELLDHANRLLQSGDCTAAVQLCRQVLKHDDMHVGALETCAKALWVLGEYPETLRVADALLRIEPLEPGYRELRANCLQCLGQYGAALVALPVNASGAQTSQLEALQAELVEGLCASDPVFRAAYAQDPGTACSDRGFAFREQPETESSWVPASDRSWLTARPS
jgi:hypothetical protein